ncbi:amino acid adenylation domain-containing protein, partial [Nocardia sp. NPDC051463]|uniref:amino acid adenylation domain-containing protein n=1 Tax=Nocardia sp. NPDC051463 TaxID=3154845 RepID=UPI00341EE797
MDRLDFGGNGETEDANGGASQAAAEYFPLSPAQLGIWYAQHVDPHVPINIAQYLELNGDLDLDALRQAGIDAGNESQSGWLRIIERDGQPMQAVDTSLSTEVGYLDLRNVDDPEAAAAEWMRAEYSRPLDIVNDRLFWNAVLQLEDQRWFVFSRIHHIVLDGFGAMTYMKRIAELYTAAVTGTEASPAKADSLRTLYEQEIAYRDSTRFQADKEHWAQRVAGLEDGTSLAGRSAPPAPFNNVASAMLSPEQDTLLAEAVARHDNSPAGLLIAGFAGYLAQWTGAEEVILSLPVTARTTAAMRRSGGATSNIVPLRMRVGFDTTVAELLKQVQVEVSGALRHQRYRHEDIRRDAAGDGVVTTEFFGPWVNIMLFQNEVVFGDMASQLNVLSTGSIEDLGVNFYQSGAGTRSHIDFETNPNLYTAAEATQHHSRFLEFFDRFLAADADTTVWGLQATTDAERIRTLHEWNDAEQLVPDTTLPALLDAQISRTPHKIALDFEDATLTYAEFAARVNRLARFLIADGVGPESLVALGMRRSLELVIGMHAVLKAGGAYVPIDPDHPADRTAYILDSADPVCVLTLSHDELELPDTVRRVEIDTLDVSAYSDAPVTDSERLAPLRPGNTAYVIYTSGSTGRPKGVAVTHHAIVNQQLWMLDEYQLSADDVYLQKTATTFDVSLWGYFLPLLVGAKLLIAAPDGHRDPLYVADMIQRHGVTVTDFVPSMLTVFVAHATAAQCVTLKDVFVIGEALPPETAAGFRAITSAGLHNLYGPTEAAVSVTYWEATAADTVTVPIGIPEWNVQVYVLDSRLRPAAIGAPGELYLGGRQLARGYRGRPDLTADRFVANPFGLHGDRMYRTGDLVRWNSVGTLEYIGRTDFQVKFRGQRIELGEIETDLLAHTAVSQAAVLVVDTATGQQLVAYVVPAPGYSIDPAELTRFAAEQLPSYMVPAAIMVLDAFPLNTSGKLDRKALPEPVFTADAAGFRAPRTQAEQVVAGIFADVLSQERIGVDDNFFDLGGNSLVATQVVARIGAAFGIQLGVRALFETPTVAGIALRAETATPTDGFRPPLVAQRRPDRVPLSLAQQRMWFINQFDPTVPTYNLPFVVRLRGHVDVDALQPALADVLTRQESLRTIFPEFGDSAYQQVLPTEDIDLGLTVQPIEESELLTVLTEFASTGFDVSRELPIRVRAYQITGSSRNGTADYILAFVVHHIAADGFSFGPLARDVATAYLARSAGEPPAWAPLSVQYRDYSLWQRELLGAETDPDSMAAREIAYWQGTLAGLPDQLELPTDRQRPPVQSFRGAQFRFEIDAELHAQLTGLARAQGATPFMVLHASLALLLARLSGTTDIAIGTPIAGRGEQALDDLIGMFVNTLVLRSEVEPALSFAELLARTREIDLAAFAHADVPFERLVDVLNPTRSQARHPLFQVMLSFQEMSHGTLELPDLSVSADELEVDIAKFDLLWTMTEQRGAQGEPDGVSVVVSYATDLFDADTVSSFADRLLRILRQIIVEPAAVVGDIELLDEHESLLSLADWHGDVHEIDTAATIVDLVNAQAAATPDAIAVVDRSAEGALDNPASPTGESLTYAEFGARVHRLARRLIEAGVGPDVPVALGIRRSIELMAAIHAVLEAGGTYVPLDLDQPAERIAHILDTAAPAVVLTTSRDWFRPEGLPVLVIDDIELSGYADGPVTDGERTAPLRPEHLAYAIFTSGSTGRPKGVGVSHAALMHQMRWLITEFGINADDVALFKTPSTFDASVWEPLAPLATGARTVIAMPDGHRDAQYLADVIAADRVTIASFVPSLLTVFATSVDADALTSLRTLLVGGEAFTSDAVEAFRKLGASDVVLVNLYGPTEFTVNATHAIAAEEVRGAVPIGRPVWNTQAYVLDSRLHPVPPGVAGELYLAGAQLARGYLGRADMTADRFVVNPFGPDGTRMYRTGDLVKRDADGVIEYIGRTDYQVKLRGVRVELGEVESALRSYPEVSQAVALVRSDNRLGDQLVGYVVPVEGGAEDRAAFDVALRAHLATRLPSYMVPAVIVPIDAIPLSPNGKLDRRALPAPVFEVRAFRAPSTPIEEIVAQVFGEVLDLPRVGVDDDFFDLGGNSLIATQVVSRVGNALDTRVPVRMLFEAPTVAALAARVESQAGDGAGKALVVRERPEEIPLSLAQQRMWFLNRFDTQSAVNNMPMAIRLSGELDVAALQVAVIDVIDRHESLRTVFPETNSGPVQVVLDAAQIVPDLTPYRVTEETLVQHLIDLASMAFDVTSEVPLHARLFEISETEYVLGMVVHHISADGWSMAPLSRDVIVAYAARTSWEAPTWAELPVQYADYALWQREVLGSETDPSSLISTQIRYWQRELADLPDELVLPWDHPRPAAASYRGGTYAFVISGETQRALVELGRRYNSSLFMVMHSALAVLLARASGTSDIAIGTPVAGRGEAALDDLIGMFVNTLVLRTNVDGATSFADQLAKARETDLHAFAHSDVPFERLVEVLNPARSQARHPLFQVMLAFQNIKQATLQLPGLSVNGIDYDAQLAKFDLMLTLSETQDDQGAAAGMSAEFSYALDLFDEATVAGFARQLDRILAAAIADPEVPVGDIDLLAPQERAQVLVDWNDTAHAVPAETLVSLFENQVRRSPDAVALVFEGEQLTYAEFAGRARRLARKLMADGVGTESLVALAIRRSIDLVVAIYAVLEAGAGYVPLDPDQPADRIGHVLDTARPVAVLTTERDGFATELAPVLAIDTLELDGFDTAPITDSERVQPIRLANTAYVIFTSGSTGRPKGVAVSHGSVVNRLLWLQSARVPLDHTDAVLQKTPLTFDVSVPEFFWPLQVGARLVMARPDGHQDPAYIADLIRREGITSAHFVPSMMAVFVADQGDVPTLRQVFASGEALPVVTAQRMRELTGARLHNLYGPTEAAVEVTFHEVTDADTVSVPMGAPVWNTRTLVLDARLHPVAVGVAGELYLAGVQLARGYLGRPELTADRFVANPYGAPGERMYRTGDLVKWTANAELEYLGRTDFQVKLRGLRIELGEIEAALLALPGVSQSVVLVRSDAHAGDQLVGYVVAEPDTTVDIDAAKAALATSLPGYMIPAALVVLAEFPVNASGKLDRKALPAPVFEAKRFRAPSTPIEEIVADVFADLLGVARVGVDDDFFELGGNSLVATQVIARIGAALNAEIGVRVLFEASTVAGLAARVESHAGTGGRERLTARTRPEYPPLSLAQQRVWFLNRFDADSAANNIPVGVRLQGALDLPALRGAIADVFARHESLRTIYPSHDGVAYQRVLPSTRAVPELDVVAISEDEMIGALHEFVGRGFDVTAQAPVRLRAYQLGEQDYVLIVVVHHIASDGFSIRPLVRDLMTAYVARTSASEPGWPPLAVQYIDFALWQRETLGSEDDPTSLISEQLDYWRGALAGLPDELRLAGRPRPAVASYQAGTHRFRVPGELIDELNRVAHAHGTTLFMVVHSAFAALLARLSGSDDIAIGIPVAGRGDQALDDLVGMFVNTLVLRAQVDSTASFADLLAQVRERDLQAFAHADVPFERLVEVLNPARSQARHPLFQVMLTFQNLGRTSLELPGLTVSELGIDAPSAKFDMQLTLSEVPGGTAEMDAELVYATDLFDAAFANTFAERFVRVLRGVAIEPSIVVGDIEVLDPSERSLVLERWNATEFPVDAALTSPVGDAAATLVSLFEAQVARTPDEYAVTFEGTSLSYAEFAERVHRLARWLKHNGVGPESYVALGMRRSIDLVVGMYAINAAGGAYVPLDPDHPAERIDYILDTARPVCVLTSGTDLETTVSRQVRIDELDLSEFSAEPLTDADRHRPLRPANTAYVIFTSGSTGRPKGVAVSHAAIVNRLVWMHAEYGLAADDVVVQKTPATFDVSVWEFFWPLQVGARLVIAKPDGHRDPAYLAQLITDEQITTVHFVPSMLSVFVSSIAASAGPSVVTPAAASGAEAPAAAECTSLRNVFASGEALPAVTAQRLRELTGARLHNLYGPTEAAVDVTFHEVTDVDIASVPIGAPVFNTRVYVLDSRLRPVPVGVPGELYLAGAQLAHGYVARPDLTTERFLADPFGTAERMYRTGDLVAWTADGELEYLGRTDFQVKLRGLRIELGEIESALTALPNVAQAVVLVRTDERTGDQLVAYLIAAARTTVDIDAVKIALGGRLPAYMVPSAYVVLDAFPLNASGKLDRKALPAPTFAAKVFRAPSTPVQEIVASTFAEVLGLDRVGLDDDFFELGGNSLVATQVAARLGEALDAQIPVRVLFEASNVAALASRVESAAGQGGRAPLVAQPRPELVPLSLAQQRMWFLNRFDNRTAVNNIPVAIRLTGALDTGALDAAIADVLARHEALRTVYPEVEGTGYQRVLTVDEVRFELAPEPVTAAALPARIVELASVHFDVTSAAPFRAALLSLDARNHVVVFVMHHISADGFSLRPLLRDVVVAYSERARGEAPVWAPLEVQYADYALWQREVLGSADDPESVAAAQIAYWTEQLRDLPDQIELPTDRPRPEIATNAGGMHNFSVDAELHKALTEVGRAHGVTLFMVVHAALAAWAARLSNSTDIAIGTPIAGRGERALDDLVGMFVNTLVLRNEVDPGAKFSDLLEQVRRTDLTAFANADVPFEQLVDVISPARSQAHHPLFQVALTFEAASAAEMGTVTLPGLELDVVEFDTGTAKFDVQLTVGEAADGVLNLSWNYATELFDPETVASFADRLMRILQSVAEDPAIIVGDIDLLGEAERLDVSQRWVSSGADNGAGRFAEADATLAGLFDAAALAHPQRTAAKFGADTLTYAELDRRANVLARRLIADGAGPESLVAVILPRSLDLVVALLAVVKTGAGYVPVDPTYPADRIAFVLSDSRPTSVVVDSTVEVAVPEGLPTVVVDGFAVEAGDIEDADDAPITDADRNAPLTPDSVAYVIYTSGSTGR